METYCPHGYFVADELGPFQACPQCEETTMTYTVTEKRYNRNGKCVATLPWRQFGSLSEAIARRAYYLDALASSRRSGHTDGTTSIVTIEMEDR